MHLINKLGISYNRKVIFSTDDNPVYYIFMPIVARSWIKMGYHPICIVVGNYNTWMDNSQRKLVIENTLDAGGDIYFLELNRLHRNIRMKRYLPSAISQVSRLRSACLNCNSDDYCLTSDIDMIPCNKEWFSQQDMTKKIHLFYANGYNHNRYAMCYIGMKKSTWAEVLKLPSDLYLAITKIMINLGQADKQTQWNYDEIFITKNIKSTPGYPDMCQMIDRKIYPNPYYDGSFCGIPAELPEGRIDRSNWVFNGDISLVIDAHCKRPIWKDWYELCVLLSHIFSDTEMKLVNNYFELFMRENIV